MTVDKLNEALEALIDATNCEAVCLGLATVCHEKSAHLASNWQDKDAARRWYQMAQRFTTIAGAAERRGI